jgi:hypothetical protein
MACGNSSKLSDRMKLSLLLSSRKIRRVFSCRFLLILPPAALLLAVNTASLAQGTRLWSQSRFEEFEKGTPQGVAISSDGKLRSGPAATEMLTTPSSFVWSVAMGKAGVVYLATGSPATVLRVDPDKTATPRFQTLFETKALAVQVVRLGPDGALYAATLPDGKVYRIKTDAAAPVDESSAEVVFDLAKLDGGAAGSEKPDDKKQESKSRYIWDMTFDSTGRLYVATGGPGAVYRLNVRETRPKADLFFKSDEQHIRTLAWDNAGNLLAGSDGSGLVYRIDPNGKGYVLFSAPRREITALAVGKDGTVYAADVGDKNHNPLPQLPVQAGIGGITISFVNPGSVQAANASTALPDGTEIYALTPNAAPRRIWGDKDDIVYQLGMNQDDLTVLTGNRGRIFTIHSDGSFSDIAHLEAQQAVSMLQTPQGMLVGTANTGKLYAVSGFASAEAEEKASGVAYQHSYASDVLDAGALARWGHVEAEPGSRGYQIWTRSGNVEQPVRSAKDWGWSDWQQTSDNKIASPPGRYLQWKVVLSGDAVVGGIGINYLPVNSAPVLDEVVVVPGARVTQQQMQTGQPGTVTVAFPNPAPTGGVVFDPNAGAATAPIQAQKDRTAVTVRWAAHDDDSDDLIYNLFLRGDGEHVWRPLKKALTDKVYSFDGSAQPDGGYQIRVVVSDAPSHSPGDALTGEMVSDRFELDTTPPVISGLKAGGECGKTPCPGKLSIPVNFDAKDATSTISHAEYSVDAGPWQYIEPVGGLSDAKEEHYSVAVPLPVGADGKTDAEPEHLITVRAYDRHENMATAKVVVPGSAPREEK